VDLYVAPDRENDVTASGLRRQPIIARIWTGRTRRDVADEYLEYNYEHGALEIEKKPGCLGAQVFRRDDGDVTEFTTISYWPSVDAMRAMHGDGGDVRRVAHLPRDREYLLELPEFVEIRELYANDWALPQRT
jgi:heme-degrading monooxygenase HmoA